MLLALLLMEQEGVCRAVAMYYYKLELADCYAMVTRPLRVRGLCMRDYTYVYLCMQVVS